MSLIASYSGLPFEAGLDEAGRGCLAGPVVAAAVVLPSDFSHPLLDDSKKLTHEKRLAVREAILDEALAWNVGMKSAPRIDEINILQANFEAMHEAIAGLDPLPLHLIIDGNAFKTYESLPHTCIVKGDSKYMSIAAASILAKTYRDEVMEYLDHEYPQYGWKGNKGYPTKAHKEAIQIHGPSPYHRRSFKWQT